MDLGYDPGPREAEFQRKPEKVPEKLDNINIKCVSERKMGNMSQPLQILLDLVKRTVWDQEIFKFQEMEGEIKRIIRMEIAEEKSIAAMARHLEIEEVKRGRVLRAEEKTKCILKAINQRFVEVTIIETSSLAVEIVEKK